MPDHFRNGRAGTTQKAKAGSAEAVSREAIRPKDPAALRIKAMQSSLAVCENASAIGKKRHETISHSAGELSFPKPLPVGFGEGGDAGLKPEQDDIIGVHDMLGHFGLVL